MAKSSQSTIKNKENTEEKTTVKAANSLKGEANKEEKGKKFENEGVVFRAKLIGIELVPESRGDKMCQSSIQKLKAIIKGTNCHKKRITLKISYDGIKVFDEKTSEIIHHHKVPEISYIASDDQDSRAFGYVFGMPTKTLQFICFKTTGPAVGVMSCISELFEAVLDKKNKEKEEKQNKEDNNVLSTSDQSILNGDCSSNSIGTNSSSSGIGSSAGSVSISSARQDSIDHLSSLLFGSSPSPSPSAWGTSSLAQQVNKHQQHNFQAVSRQPTVEKLLETNSNVGHIPLLPSPPSKHRQLTRGSSGNDLSTSNSNNGIIRSSSPLFSLDEFWPPMPAPNTAANPPPGSHGINIGHRHSDRNKSSASVFSLSNTNCPAPAPVSSSLQNESYFASAFAASSSSSASLAKTPVSAQPSLSTNANNNSSGLLRQLSVTSNDSTDRYAAFNELHNFPSVFESAVIQQQQQLQQPPPPPPLFTPSSANNTDTIKFHSDMNNFNQESRHQQQHHHQQQSSSVPLFGLPQSSSSGQLVPSFDEFPSPQAQSHQSSQQIFRRTNPFADDFFW